jgi:hypothetical protein
MSTTDPLPSLPPKKLRSRPSRSRPRQFARFSTGPEPRPERERVLVEGVTRYVELQERYTAVEVDLERVRGNEGDESKTEELAGKVEELLRRLDEAK